MSQPSFLEVWSVTLLVDGLRYVVAAGAAFLICWVVFRERLRRWSVFGRYADAAQMLHDVAWSLSTILIFSLFGAMIFYGRRADILRGYERISDYGWAWTIASVPLLIVLQDAYFYWTHRAMHHPRLFRWVHRVHHASSETSPWTAYAFSPIEAAVHAAFVPLTSLVLPLHDLAVFCFLLFMVLRNVLGHLSIELFPVGFVGSKWWSWSTTTTHHALHHRYPSSNFGLYFTLWDRIAGTTRREYEQVFVRIRSRPRL
jgi:Delta7-sterol 5-desaturase